jgi:hypothetical protein
MTDGQMITLAVVFVAAMGSILYNNSRITDVGKRIDDLRDSVNRHIDDKFALLSQQMKTMEDNIMRIVGEHESRIQTVEGKKP